MSKAELREQIEAMTEEEAAEVKLIYAPAWPDKAIPIEEIRKGDDGPGARFTSCSNIASRFAL